jgi:hypothetical protein
MKYRYGVTDTKEDYTTNVRAVKTVSRIDFIRQKKDNIQLRETF